MTTVKEFKQLDVTIKVPYVRKHYYKLRSVGVNAKDAYKKVKELL